jgi:uncharacterized membrane protein YhhN
MPWYFALPIVTLLAVLPFFLRAEYQRRRSVMLPLKLVCSLCFVLLGVFGAVIGRAGPVAAYDGLMLAGLVLSLAGDMLLGWSLERRTFLLGLVAFLVAHLLYSTAFSLANGFSAWDLLIMAVVAGGCVAAYQFLDMDLGKMKIPVLVYLLVISFMLTKAFSSLYLGGITGAALWLVVIGAVLFFVSDALLALVKFQRNPARANRAMNLTAYYIGQTLLALSLYFF